jgi:hypothetical protein
MCKRALILNRTDYLCNKHAYYICTPTFTERERERERESKRGMRREERKRTPIQ